MQTEDDLEITTSFPVGLEMNTHGFRSAFDVWDEMLSAAESKILIAEMYIASNGMGTAAHLLDTLTKKARLGVGVLVIVDEHTLQRNSRSAENWYLEPISKLEEKQNIQIHYDGVHDVTGGIQHSKIVVVDSTGSWIGSNNFDWRSFEHILELGVKINHKELSRDLNNVLLASVFSGQPIANDSVVEDNSFGLHTVTYKSQKHTAQIVGGPHGCVPHYLAQTWKKIVTLANEAQQEISLQARKISVFSRAQANTEWHLVVDALMSAAARGVKVRLMFDEYQVALKENAKLVSELGCKKNISVKLVRIPDAADGYIPHARMLHSKSFTVDRTKSWVGSNNFAPDDFLKSRNFGIVVAGEKFSKDVLAVFDEVWDSEYAFTFGALP